MSVSLSSIADFVSKTFTPTEAPAQPLAKPDLDTVREQYQVQDDEVIEYHPRAFGIFDIPFTDGVTMTKTEGELIDQLTRDRGVVGLSDFNDLKNDVFDEAASRYPPSANVPEGIPADRADEWQGNDGHQDAFRHAYWNARMAKEYGPEWTEQFATAHEGLPGNPATREAMDLYNNEVGRRIAVENPDASDEELANLVQQAVENGELLVIDSNGELAWSNDVPVGQHGLTSNETIDGKIGTPDGDAYTSS